MSATATFNDVYAGATEMKLEASKKTIRGERVTVYRWVAADRGKCVTTGFAGAFGSIARAVANAERHALFSNVVVA